MAITAARPTARRPRHVHAARPILRSCGTFPLTMLAAALGVGMAIQARAQTQSGDPGSPQVAQMPAVSIQASAVDDDTLVHLGTPVNSGALGSRTRSPQRRRAR